MGLNRSKQNRKMMQHYGLTFGFREPYQVLVDAAMLQEAAKCKMNLMALLEKTLHGHVKLMITQCSMRHLYASKDDILIEHAKAFERRRCDHHELEEPLSTLQCLGAVVGPRNKHRYVVASQDTDLRGHLRTIAGVPLIYIRRSVMILEPIAHATEDMIHLEERMKFKSGLKGRLQTRGEIAEARNVANTETGMMRDSMIDTKNPGMTVAVSHESAATKRKRKRGLSAPNPLSVKKAKKPKTNPSENEPTLDRGIIARSEEKPASLKEATKRPRRRRHNAGKEDEPTTAVE